MGDPTRWRAWAARPRDTPGDLLLRQHRERVPYLRAARHLTVAQAAGRGHLFNERREGAQMQETESVPPILWAGRPGSRAVPSPRDAASHPCEWTRTRAPPR